MFNPADLIREIQKLFGDHPPFEAYNIRDTVILYGAPPIKVQNGIDYISARHDNPQVRKIQSLNGTGVFLSNNNWSGTIEFALLQGCASAGAVQALNMLGLPLPIIAIDTKSAGTSFIFATSCRPVGTPEWRRDAYPGRNIFTFSTPRLFISEGIREAV